MCLPVPQVSRLCVRSGLTCANVCIKIGYLLLDAAGYAVLDVGDALD